MLKMFTIGRNALRSGVCVQAFVDRCLWQVTIKWRLL